jgi:hypothetical protein
MKVCTLPTVFKWTRAYKPLPVSGGMTPKEIGLQNEIQNRTPAEGRA